MPAPGFVAPVDFRLANNPPNDIGDPQMRAVLDEVYNALQQVFSTFVDMCGIGPQARALWPQLAGTSLNLLSSNLNRLYVTAFEPISFGNMLNLILDAGILKAQLANATDATKPCQGFCNSEAVIAGQLVEMILHSGVASIAGLTPGTKYYLSKVTSGLVTAVAPVAAGNIEQYVGVAIDATHLFFYTHHWIQH